MRVDQPPPVSQQKPVWRPGSRAPKAMCSQLPRSPRAQAAQTGSMPRVTQPSTGSTTTRPAGSAAVAAASGRSATTSWPGTNGNDTIGSK